MPELANQVSGVVLLLLAALRQTYPVGEEGDGGNKDSGGGRWVYVVQSHLERFNVYICSSYNFQVMLEVLSS